MDEKFDCDIFCFEPVSSFARAIEERFGDKPNIKVFNIGLSDINGNMDISLESDGSSFYHSEDSIKKYERTKMVNVNDFISEHGIDEIDLMKLNVEGAEYPLLEEMIRGNTMKKVKYLQVQFHDVAPDSKSRMNNIIKELEKTHDLMWSYRPFVWESWVRKEEVI